MEANLFTLVLTHPGHADAIIEGARLNDITAIALGASPVSAIFIIPADFRHAGASGQRIIETANTLCLAKARTGGFDVTFHGAGDRPKWASEVIRGLDYNERLNRKLKAAMRLQEAETLASGPKTGDTSLEADRARERARGVVLPHDECREMFEIEARGRLVTA